MPSHCKLLNETKLTFLCQSVVENVEENGSILDMGK